MNTSPFIPDRLWIVDPAGQVVCAEISEKLSAAFDILADAGMANEERVSLLVHCERNPDGPFNGEPEALARKLVMLAKAMQP